MHWLSWIPPVADLQVPAGHGVQFVAPGFLLYVPAGQYVHVEKPVAPTTDDLVPGGHMKQENTDVPPVSGLYVPAGHNVQLTDLAREYVPGMHAMHKPLFGLKGSTLKPAWHAGVAVHGVKTAILALRVVQNEVTISGDRSPLMSAMKKPPPTLLVGTSKTKPPDDMAVGMETLALLGKPKTTWTFTTPDVPTSGAPIATSESPSALMSKSPCTKDPVPCPASHEGAKTDVPNMNPCAAVRLPRARVDLDVPLAP